MQNKKEDILAFLDARFSKLEAKSKKKKQEKKAKPPQPHSDAKTPMQAAFEGIKEPRLISESSLYNPLIAMNPQQKEEAVRKFTEVHLKNPSAYDQELKTKIFFIGQNSLAAQPQVIQPPEMSLRQ